MSISVEDLRTQAAAKGMRLAHLTDHSFRLTSPTVVRSGLSVMDVVNMLDEKPPPN
jgi:hypothetical protein